MSVIKDARYLLSLSKLLSIPINRCCYTLHIVQVRTDKLHQSSSSRTPFRPGDSVPSKIIPYVTSKDSSVATLSELINVNNLPVNTYNFRISFTVPNNSVTPPIGNKISTISLTTSAVINRTIIFLLSLQMSDHNLYMFQIMHLMY